MPWDEVSVDLIGLWTVKIRGKTTREVFALTIIDTTSNLVELVQIENKTLENVARRFHNTWLARYPQPERVIHNNGREFTGQEFQGLLYNLGIKPAGITIKNPQSNAICERMHQIIATILKTTIEALPRQNVDDVNNLVEDSLAAAMHSLCATVSKTLKLMPGWLAFLATCY